ncbi:phospholipid scramblase 2-like [Alligator mississippiensis]|uniref:Phospholipid scramblase n=1 Tax=Alligator mississippiensis TaxID=8496 RepID=A0A151PDQ2_ALLMI|nr:phospholipid scramblase 2-like [Alligator mississippiensis]
MSTVRQLPGIDGMAGTFAGLLGDLRRSYTVGSAQVKELLVATEEADRLCLLLCGPARATCIRLQDPQGCDILRFHRPYWVGACCLGACWAEMRVFGASNQLVGSVQQRWSALSHRWEVCNARGTGTMSIQGSCATSRCSTEQEFQVTSHAGSPLAVIWKRWPGFSEDCNRDHEFFGVDISAPVGAEDGALLLAAAFLLNFMFFEMS